MALREILARFGFDVDNKNLAKADRSVEGLVHKFESVGKAIIGAAVVQEIAEFTKGLIEQGSELENGAKRLGISAQSLQKWQVAANMADVSAQSINTALKFLSKGAAAGTDEVGGKVSEAFDKLGVSTKDANGEVKAADVLLREVGGALADMTNPTERTAAAIKLFGKQGTELIPLFTSGKDKLEEWLGALDEFGGGLSNEFLEAAGEAEESTKKYTVAITSAKSALGAAFLPALAAVINGIARAVAWFSRVTKNTSLWSAVLTILAATLVRIGIAKFGADLVKLAASAAKPFIALTLLVLVVEDFITMLRGGKSAMGAGLDALFGAGTAERAVANIKTIFNLIKNGDFGAIVDILGGLFDALLSKIDAAIDKIMFKIQGKLHEIAPMIFDAPVMPGAKTFTQKAGGDTGNLLVQPYKEAPQGPGIGLSVDTTNQLKRHVASTKAAAAAGAPVLQAGGQTLAQALTQGFVEGLANTEGLQGTITGWTSLILQTARDGIGARSPSTKAVTMAQDFLAGWRAPFAALGPGGAVAMAFSPTSASAPALGPGGGGGPIFQTTVALTVGAGTTQAQVGMAQSALSSALSENRQALLAAVSQTAEAPARAA